MLERKKITVVLSAPQAKKKYSFISAPQAIFLSMFTLMKITGLLLDCYSKVVFFCSPDGGIYTGSARSRAVNYNAQ